MRESTLRKILFFLTAAALFAPLIVLPNKFIFPFIVPKIVFLRGIFFLMLGAFVLLYALARKEYHLKLSPIKIIVLLFFLSFAVSSFVGIDPYRSIWDGHERMLGLFTFMHYTFFFLVITWARFSKKEWGRLFHVFLGVGSVVCFLALIQKVSPDFLLNKGNNRVSSTLGNAIYLGGYGIFIFFLGLLYAVREFLSKKRMSHVAGYAIAAIVGLLGSFASETRGVIIALLPAGASLIGVYALAYRQNKKVQKLAIAIAVVAVVGIGSLALFRNTSFVQSIPGVRRILTITSHNGASTRLTAWKIAYEGWQERPLFGWGPNNYYYAFNEYYRPPLLKHGYGETWFDNAHNAALNTLTVQGGIGFVLYLLLFLTPLYYMTRAVKEKNVDIHTAAFFGSFLVFHFVQQLFVFENPTSYIYLFFVLGYIDVVLNDSFRTGHREARKVGYGTAALVGACVFIFVFATNVQPARANMATLDTIRALHTNDSPMAQFERALSIPSPHIDDIRLDFARNVSNIVGPYVQNGLRQEALTLIRRSQEEMRKNITLHPADIRYHLELTKHLQLDANISGNMSALQEAEHVTREAITYSTERQQLYYTLGGVLMQMGRAQEAEQAILTAKDLDVSVSHSWWRLALIYDVSGDTERAKEIIMEAGESYRVMFPPESLPFLTKLFGERESVIVRQLVGELPWEN